MTEIYVEHRKNNKPSRRTVEKLGQGPDQSGVLILNNGTMLDIDLSRVHPDYDWSWKNQGDGKEHWPVRIRVLSTPEVKATESPYLRRLADQGEGINIELGEKGSGALRLTNTRSLIVKLNRYIWVRNYKTWGDITEKYYPDYPELSRVTK